jgi:hypothetical protein
MGLDLDGGYAKYGYCIWQPKSRDSYLENYAADVLALFSVAMPRKAP